MSSPIFDTKHASPSPSGEGLGWELSAGWDSWRRPTPFPSPDGEGRKAGLAFVLPLLFLGGACSRSDNGIIDGRRPIACLLPGQGSFQTACTLERMPSPDGPVLVARGPDGGFRRLLVVKDGRGVIAADGAEPVAVKPSGRHGIDVAAGGVVYRLPARIVP